MAIEISTLSDEGALRSYLDARNAPRDTITFGVRPNCIKAIAEYENLVASLSGDDDHEDMSAYLDYHNSVVSQVSPFIEVMKCAMKIMRDTPQLVDQLAVAQEQDAPFGVVADDMLDPADYAAMLSNTLTAISAVLTILSGE